MRLLFFVEIHKVQALSNSYRVTGRIGWEMFATPLLCIFLAMVGNGQWDNSTVGIDSIDCSISINRLICSIINKSLS